MMERIAQIEDAILTALRAAHPDIPPSSIETRNVPLTEQELKAMIGRAPFIYVEYYAGMPKVIAENGTVGLKRWMFTLFVASKSLRSRKEGQRGSYDLLDKCYDALSGIRLSDDGWSAHVNWQSEQLFYDSDEGGTIYQQVFAVDGPP
jgi:phage gp37-like protein